MNIKQNLFTACLVALVGTATTSMAQGSAQTPRPQQPAQPQQQQQQPKAPESSQANPESDQTNCPDFVRGSKLTVNEIDRGVQVTVTTPKSGSVQSLRTMTHNAAGYVESNERHGSAAPSKQGGQQAQQGQLPPLDITVTDIADGAKVNVKAKNSGDIPAVREQAKKLEKLWQTDACINGQQTAT
jgi:hypothetical protein